MPSVTPATHPANFKFRLPHAVALAIVAGSPAAWAHHAMDGQLPATFSQGLLSGLAHPIIGLDHLAVVIAVGLLSLALAGRYLLPLAFVAGALAGAVVHLQAASLPLAETVIAVSLLVFGTMLLLRSRLPTGLLAMLFAAVGLFHGYAYAESIVGAEQSPLTAYLIGFSAIQYAIAGGVMVLAEKLWTRQQRLAPLRIGGGVIASFGALLIAQQLAG